MATLPDDHRDLPTHEGGRPRLLAFLDREDALGRVMTEGVIYSLSDRPCSSCVSGKRNPPGVSVPLVKERVNLDSAEHFRLYTLCEEHAQGWESRKLSRS